MMNWEPSDFDARLQACFQQIADTRMDGIPILNKKLGVAVTGTREWNGGLITVLTTPWFMSILYRVCEQDIETPTERAGTKQNLVFPSGRYEFICGYEPAIGTYWTCSLFSPVFEFEDMETAIETARAAAEEIFEGDDDTAEDELTMGAMWRGEWQPETEADVEEADAEEDAIAVEDAAEESAETNVEPVKKAPVEMSRRQLFMGMRSQKPDSTEPVEEVQK